jgi:hypothetical protein
MGGRPLYPRRCIPAGFGSRLERSEIVAPIVLELRFVDWLARGKRARLGLKLDPRLGRLGRLGRGVRGSSRSSPRRFALSCWKRAHLQQSRIECLVSKLDRTTASKILVVVPTAVRRDTAAV